MGEGYSIMPDAVLDLAADGKLTRIDVLVYAVLARHCDRQGECYPGHKRLAELARADKRSIVRAVTNLAKHAVIETTKGGGRGNLNGYYLPHQKNVDTTTPNHPKNVDATPRKGDITRSRPLFASATGRHTEQWEASYEHRVPEVRGRRARDARMLACLRRMEPSQRKNIA